MTCSVEVLLWSLDSQNHFFPLVIWMKCQPRWVLCFLLSVLACARVKEQGAENTLAATVSPRACETVIVGGGLAGLYTAYQIVLHREEYPGAIQTTARNICLFERENRLGGRIYDTAQASEDRRGPWIAVGARRVMEGQRHMFQLAQELGLNLETPPLGADLIYARGKYGTKIDDFASLYPGMPYDPSQRGVQSQLYAKLLNGPDRSTAIDFLSFRTYGSHVLGKEGYQFLADMSRFRGDYQYPLSAEGYLEYLAEEAGVCCVASYPVGGMSSFIRALEEKVRSRGVQVFMSEAVEAIDQQGDDFLVRTSLRTVSARRVILAVPPLALRTLDGNVASRIQAQPQFKALVPVSVTTITQWYKEPWWHHVKTRSGQPVWRAWTTDHETCLNAVEFPQEAYGAAQNVIRAVYNDDPACVSYWERMAKGSPQALEEAVHKGLVKLFAHNNTTTPVTIPHAAKTFYWLWKGGWYMLAASSRFTNADIANWAVAPLPHVDVGLVSEGFHPQRAAWSDGAIKAVLHYLHERFPPNSPRWPLNRGLTPQTLPPNATY